MRPSAPTPDSGSPWKSGTRGRMGSPAQPQSPQPQQPQLQAQSQSQHAPKQQPPQQQPVQPVSLRGSDSAVSLLQSPTSMAAGGKSAGLVRTPVRPPPPLPTAVASTQSLLGSPVSTANTLSKQTSISDLLKSRLVSIDREQYFDEVTQTMTHTPSLADLMDFEISVDDLMSESATRLHGPTVTSAQRLAPHRDDDEDDEDDNDPDEDDSDAEFASDSTSASSFAEEPAPTSPRGTLQLRDAADTMFVDDEYWYDGVNTTFADDASRVGSSKDTLDYEPETRSDATSAISSVSGSPQRPTSRRGRPPPTTQDRPAAAVVRPMSAMGIHAHHPDPSSRYATPAPAASPRRRPPSARVAPSSRASDMQERFSMYMPSRPKTASTGSSAPTRSLTATAAAVARSRVTSTPTTHAPPSRRTSIVPTTAQAPLVSPRSASPIAKVPMKTVPAATAAAAPVSTQPSSSRRVKSAGVARPPRSRWMARPRAPTPATMNGASKYASDEDVSAAPIVPAPAPGFSLGLRSHAFQSSDEALSSDDQPDFTQVPESLVSADEFSAPSQPAPIALANRRAAGFGSIRVSEPVVAAERAAPVTGSWLTTPAPSVAASAPRPESPIPWIAGDDDDAAPQAPVPQAPMRHATPDAAAPRRSPVTAAAPVHWTDDYAYAGGNVAERAAVPRTGVLVQELDDIRKALNTAGDPVDWSALAERVRQQLGHMSMPSDDPSGNFLAFDEDSDTGGMSRAHYDPEHEMIHVFE